MRYRLNRCGVETKLVDIRKQENGLWPIREVFYLPRTVRSLVEQNVIINETLVAFRGRCIFCEYIPSKLAKFEIKMFFLVD